jgi:hypothetical protein
MAKKDGEPLFLPCTPKGIIHLLKSTGVEIAGKQAAVVGRSDIVGAPVATLLTAEHATVTLCHSRTPDIENIVSELLLWFVFLKVTLITVFRSEMLILLSLLLVKLSLSREIGLNPELLLLMSVLMLLRVSGGIIFKKKVFSYNLLKFKFL